MLTSQCKIKHQSARGNICSRNTAAMQNNGILYYCQSQTSTAYFPAPSLVHTIESLEKTCNVLMIHSDAVVGISEMPWSVIVLMGRDCDGCAVARIGDGVVCEVAEYAVDHAGRACHYDILRY